MRLAVAALITKRTVSALVLVLAAMAVIVIIVVVFAAFGLGKLLVGTLNDFVELAAVEPDAAALGTVINFNSLAIRNGQQDVAFWTIYVV
ncbi:MAG: hypothetical protein Q7T20_00355 [Saprospiraceae bacterium]|nr:hypothetical protein [Saprospiraceae bacterium]